MKRLAKNLAAASVVALVCATSAASTWNYYIDAGNDEARYFFDSDTVDKQHGIVTFWIKSVQTYRPNRDGAWASAEKWRVNCSAKTTQILTSSDYDKDGRFIKAWPNPSKEISPPPDSIAAEIVKVTCKSDFPKSKSEKDYFVLKDNDVYRATRSYVDFEKSKIDQAPK